VGAVTPLAVANYWSEAKGTRGLGKGEIEPSSEQIRPGLAHGVNATIDVNNLARGFWEPIR
jgi:hypothetical protein